MHIHDPHVRVLKHKVLHQARSRQLAHAIAADAEWQRGSVCTARGEVNVGGLLGAVGEKGLDEVEVAFDVYFEAFEPFCFRVSGVLDRDLLGSMFWSRALSSPERGEGNEKRTYHRRHSPPTAPGWGSSLRC